MTLPASGPISIGQVAAELGIGLPLSLGDGRVRALAGVDAFSAISLGQLRGKSAYTPMALTGTNASSGPVSSDNSGGSVSGTASVSVFGGVAPFSYQWSVIDNANSAVVSGLTSQNVNATKSFAKTSNGSAIVNLSVVVTDSTGQTASASGIQISLYWGTAN